MQFWWLYIYVTLENRILESIRRTNHPEASGSLRIIQNHWCYSSLLQLDESGRKIELKAGITNSRKSIYYNLQKTYSDYAVGTYNSSDLIIPDTPNPIPNRLIGRVRGDSVTKTSLPGLLLHYPDYNWLIHLWVWTGFSIQIPSPSCRYRLSGPHDKGNVPAAG